jgi:2-dehydropantoate 2-reductase
MSGDLKIVFLGAGVIGGSVGSWIARFHDETYFLDVGPVADKLKADGITTYPGDAPNEKEQVAVHVIDDLAEVPDADVVVIGVKNYSLDAVAKLVKEKLGDRPVIVGMQNGIANQRVLPTYFSKVIYCVVSYNAWMDEPGVIGYQKKGPLHLGALKEGMAGELDRVSAVFNLGVETEVTDRIQDAIHSKIVLNLTNSLTTLLGLGVKKIPNRALFQRLLSNLLWEGVGVVKAAGFAESKLGGMPSWFLLRLSASLPRFLTKGLFEKNVRKMVISSMAQDVIGKGSKDTELDSINGYVLELADRFGVEVPYNRAIYELSQTEFAKDDFKPIEAETVWEAVRAKL